MPSQIIIDASPMINSGTSAIPVPSQFIEDYALDILNVDPAAVRGTFSGVYQALDNWFASGNEGFLSESNQLSFG